MAWRQIGPRADASLTTNATPILDHEDGSTSDQLAKVHLAIKTQNYSAAFRTLRSFILAHPDNYIAYELRSLCALHCSDYPQALSDALRCTTLNPHWSRGWARLGAAQLCMGHARASISAYEKAKSLESNSFTMCRNEEIQIGLSLAKKQLVESGGGQPRRWALHE